MNHLDDDAVLSIWRAQPVPQMPLDTEQIRARATRFESRIRRRIRVDVISSLLLAAIVVAGAVIAEGLILRTGLLLLAAWGLTGVLLTRLVGMPDALPAAPEACRSWYLRHLARQRDYLLAAPWGMGLALPGLLLTVIGYADAPPLWREGATMLTWQQSLAFAGVMLFGYCAAVIWCRLLAGRCQQEMESLREMGG